MEFEKNYYPEEHEGKVLSIDAVPAFESGQDEYEIPDKETGTWIKTNPETHKEQSTAKNKELNGRWVPLVKMAKGWNRANGKPIKPSFLVEVMAEELVEAPFSNYPDEIRNLFAAMEANIGRPWPDPAGLRAAGLRSDDARARGHGAQGAAGGAAQGHPGAPRRRNRPAGRRVAPLARDPRRLLSALVR